MDNLHKINSISFTKLREESKLAKLIQYFRIKCRRLVFPRHFVSVIYVYSPSHDPSACYILPVQRGRRERWCGTPLLEIPQACPESALDGSSTALRRAASSSQPAKLNICGDFYSWCCHRFPQLSLTSWTGKSYLPFGSLHSKRQFMSTHGFVPKFSFSASGHIYS